MKMRDIVIIGTGGFAKEIAFLIEEINKINPNWNILGFITDNKDLIGTTHGHWKVYQSDDWLKNATSNINVAIGVGTPSTIYKIYMSLKGNKNLQFPNLIHPNVIGDFDHIELGVGNLVCAGNIFTTDIKVSSFNIFNLDCTIGHDCIIGSFNNFNPSVNISGGITIGDQNLIGTGTQILQYISLRNNIIIGAGAVVNKDVEEEGVYVGIPIKKIR